MARAKNKNKVDNMEGYIPRPWLSESETEELIDRIIKESSQHWQYWGNCVGKDPDIFCPDDYISRQTPRKAAQEICGFCPVRQLCAETALEDPEMYAWMVMGGVSLPCNPKKSGRAERQLKKACEPDTEIRRKIVWHIAMTMGALKAKKMNTQAAWDMVRAKVNWAIYVKTCSALGLTAPDSHGDPVILRKDKLPEELDYI